MRPVLVLDHAHHAAADAAQVGEVARALGPGPVPAARAPPQQPALDQRVDARRACAGPNGRQVVLGQRQLGRRGAQVRAEHVRVRRVAHGRLDARRRRSPPGGARGRCRAGRRARRAPRARRRPTRPARPGLLPQRRPRARPAARAARRPGPVTSTPSSSAFVAATPSSSPAAQRRLERAPLLGQVAARGRPRRASASSGSTSASVSRAVIATASAPRRDRTKASVRTPSTTRSVSSVGGLGRRRTPGRRVVLAAVVGQRRLPQRERRGAARRRVVGHRHDVATRRAATPSPAGSPDGRRGEHERRLGAVARRHPLQPAQHVGHVRPEHAAVDVALVDHDVAQRAQERRPALVPRQHRAVQQVGVGQHVARVRADPGALLVDGVAVVRRDPQPVERRARRPRATGRARAPWWARGRAPWRRGRSARACPRAPR